MYVNTIFWPVQEATSDLVAVLQEHVTCICATTVPGLLTWVSDGPLFGFG